MKRMVILLALLAAPVCGGFLASPAVAQATFSQHRNVASSSLATTHAPATPTSSGTLVLQPGTGQYFGTPTPTDPIRVVVSRRTTLQNGFLVPESIRTVFKATGRTGDTLTGLSVPTDEGDVNVDQTFVKNDPVQMMITVGMLKEIPAASTVDTSNLVTKTADETIAGVKTFTGTLAGNGSSLTATGGRPGEVAETIAAKAARVFHVDSFGAAGNGSDDSAAVNRAIAAAAAAGGGVVELGPKTYGIGLPLSGNVPNITIRGTRGSKLLRLLVSTNQGILSNANSYSGWTFEGIEFDGNNMALVRAAGAATFYYTLPIVGSRNVRFRRCTFRDMSRGITPNDASDVTLEDCVFYGIKPGFYQAGTWDPPAVVDIQRGASIDVIGQMDNLKVSNTLFHFPAGGIALSTAATQSVNGLTVDRCRFWGDWWDSPGSKFRFTPSAGTAANVNYATGGLAAAAPANEIISFRRTLATGTSFSSLNNGVAIITGGGFASAKVGDVIETIVGKRARVAAIATADALSYDGWESMDTYEPTTPPAGATNWRLVRNYAAMSQPISDTQLGFAYEPVNPFDGHRIVTDDAVDMTTCVARIFGLVGYTGIHVTAGCYNARITTNHFRGAWADQCSLFSSPGVIVTGNDFEYGQDEGLTLTACPYSTVSTNRFINSGVSGISHDAAYSSISTNVFRNWGLTNATRGAIDHGALGASISGNVFVVDNFPGRGWSRAGMDFLADSTGTIISSNVDAGCTEATLRVDTVAAPVAGSIVARDTKIILGTGAGNVSLPAVGGVSSVAGRTGVVTLNQADIGGLTTSSSPTFAGPSVRSRSHRPGTTISASRSRWTPPATRGATNTASHRQVSARIPGPGRGPSTTGRQTLIGSRSRPRATSCVWPRPAATRWSTATA
jgi:hypothetical protein